MDNPLAPIGHVWLAAMVDGEGTITLSRSGKRRQSTGEAGAVPEIIITNTNHAIVEAARIYLTELGISPYIKSSFQGGRRRKECFWVKVSGLTKVPKMIQAIEPYVVGKMAQLQLVKEFCDSRLAKGKPKGFAYDERELTIWKQIKILNARSATQTED